MGQSQSAYAQFGMDSTKICFKEIIDETVYTRIDDSEDTMCGTLDHDSRMVTDGIRIVKFRVITRPSPEEFDVILPFLGFTEAADTFSLVANFDSSKFTAHIDRVAKNFSYANCMVDQWILSGARGFRTWQLEMVIVGETPTTDDPATFTPTAPATRTAGYPLHKGVLTLEGSTRSFNRFALSANHFASVRWNNAQNADSIAASDRKIHLITSTPYTSNEIDLFDNAVTDADGAAASLVFTRGAQSTTITLPRLIQAPSPPDIPLRQEIRYPHAYQAYIDTDGSTDPIEIVHVP